MSECIRLRQEIEEVLNGNETDQARLSKKTKPRFDLQMRPLSFGLSSRY